jgi:enamine deaminase RidA (YjgF/YER057c/UK114 family)
MQHFETDRQDSVSFKKIVGSSAAEEWHIAVHCDSTRQNLANVLEERWLTVMKAAGIPSESTVLRRVFCSDPTKQQPVFESFARNYPGAFSIIGQPPLNGVVVSMWSYHIHDPEIPPFRTGGGASYILKRGRFRHAWNTGLFDTDSDCPGQQCRTIMNKLDDWLGENDLTLRDDVIRTWWFVRDIDVDYQALVDARKNVFENHGLTMDTHFIASTGIAGAHHAPSAKLSLDTYAIGGLVPGQVEFISAPDHLGPTHRYGVTFERATAVSYKDRKHIFISGTASIDPTGEIVHPGDVVSQLNRTLENISALLASANAEIHDLASMIVYLRDPEDGPVIEEILRQRFHNIPMVIVHAPVCRPGWLVEIEGIACVPRENPDFPAF